MNITKALQLLKEDLIRDPDILNQVEEILQEVAYSSYVAGIRDNDREDPAFTAYGSKQDW
jgi:hypothetical protein